MTPLVKYTLIIFSILLVLFLYFLFIYIPPCPPFKCCPIEADFRNDQKSIDYANKYASKLEAMSSESTLGKFSRKMWDMKCKNVTINY